MNVLFASRHPYIPQIAGGAQSSVHELALAFAALGDKPAVLSGLTGRGWLGLRGRLALKLAPVQTVEDRRLGYRVLRSWDPAAAAGEAVKRLEPDVVVVQSGHPVAVARAFSDLNVPTVVYLRNVETDDFGGDPATLKGACTFVANSHFTSSWFERRFGIESEVVYPLLQADRYVTETARERVVFINPHPQKGLDIALDLATACPQIPFLFVEAWTLDDVERGTLTARLDQLPNVELLPRTTDMRTIYKRARIVLAPSQWHEAFGRIAAEAHFSGIPVIASDIGGLPEAVGAGGRLVAPDADVSVWADALNELWHDEAAYERASSAARDHARRPELDSRLQLARLRAIFMKAASGPSPAPADAGPAVARVA